MLRLPRFAQRLGLLSIGVFSQKDVMFESLTPADRLECASGGQSGPEEPRPRTSPLTPNCPVDLRWYARPRERAAIGAVDRNGRLKGPFGTGSQLGMSDYSFGGFAWT